MGLELIAFRLTRASWLDHGLRPEGPAQPLPVVSTTGQVSYKIHSMPAGQTQPQSVIQMVPSMY